MSFTFTLTGKSSELNYDFNPPIYLDDDIEYELGLVNFDTYNSIPNIDGNNNRFEWKRGSSATLITVPPGSYELDKLEAYMENAIRNFDEDAVIGISTNAISSKINIRTNGIVNFNLAGSIGPVLGFGARTLEANDIYTSDEPIKIMKVNSVLIDCNIVVGAFLNGKPVHIIHQFFPTVPFGYKIVETPSNILYFPITSKTINNISIRILDQDGNLVDFLGETVTVRLHLRKI